MKKIIALFLIAATGSLFSQTVNWTNELQSFGTHSDAKLGTSNKRSLKFFTNDTLRLGIDSLGNVKLPKLAPDKGFQLLYVDENGNIINAKPAANYYPSTACRNSMIPWFEGGNTVGSLGSNVIGTCNNYPFILQSNAIQALFISTAGKIGLGENNSSPAAILDVSNPDVSNNGSGVQEHLRIYGDQDGTIESTGELNLFSNSGSFAIYKGAPGAGTPSFYMETNGDTHLYNKLNVGVQTASTYAALNVNATGSSSTPANAIDVFDSYTGHINFRVKSNGFIYAREVNVQLTGFPDYVFNSNYKLRNLESLERYIQLNHHLPNVPSAAEIQSAGANLGELSKIQMEKIEELTLYVIALKKEIDALKKDSNNK